jgi:AAA+ ATPase superfamily predicted ATPase
MVGKSSLVKAALNEIEGQVQVIYINLWNAKNADDMLEQLAIGIQNSKGLSKEIKDAVKGLVFTVSVKQLSVGIERRPLALISNMFSMIGQTKNPTVVVLDEVQKLATFSKPLHEMLAKIFNTYSNMTFVLTGSMFGLMRSILHAKATAPMYGRTPVELHLEPFSETVARGFLLEGFEQYEVQLKAGELDEVIRAFGGVPGWLTIYGACRAVEGREHGEALEKALEEASRIMREELNRFLANRNTALYLATLRSLLLPSGWAEIKRNVESATKHSLNPRRFQELLNTLQDALLIKKSGSVYVLADPMLKYVLTHYY